MDFSQLTEDELDEFLTKDYSEYNIFIDSELTKVEQAESLFDQLRNYPNVRYPLPIVDLYIASQYEGPKNLKYTLGQLYELTQDEINIFARLFGINPPVQVDRIIKILSYLGLIIGPEEVFLNTGVADVMCSKLSLKDLNNLMQALKVTSLNCVIPINDPDGKISQVIGVNSNNIPYLLQIESDGSLKTVMNLIRNNLSNQLEYLLSNGLKPDLHQVYENTAFMLASELGSLESVKLLLKYGNDASTSDHEINKAFMIASQNGHLEVVKLLLEYVTNVNLSNLRGYTALMLASQNGHLEVVKLLLENYADVNISGKGHDGYTALMLASENGHLEIVKLLLENGANPNYQSRYPGTTALTIASNKGRLGIVKLLLENGADPNLQAERKNTALILASRWGHSDIVNLLIKHGANIDQSNSFGNTALHEASRLSRLKTVKLLLQLKANPDIKNKDGDTALSLINKNGHSDFIQLFQSMLSRN